MNIIYEHSPAMDVGMRANPPLAKPSFIASQTVSSACFWGVSDGIISDIYFSWLHRRTSCSGSLPLRVDLSIEG